MSLSEYCRTIVLMWLDQSPQGLYSHARELALILARRMVMEISEGLPETVEEAIARGLFAPSAVAPDVWDPYNR